MIPLSLTSPGFILTCPFRFFWVSILGSFIATLQFLDRTVTLSILSAGFKAKQKECLIHVRKIYMLASYILTSYIVGSRIQPMSRSESCSIRTFKGSRDCATRLRDWTDRATDRLEVRNPLSRRSIWMAMQNSQAPKDMTFDRPTSPNVCRFEVFGRSVNVFTVIQINEHSVYCFDVMYFL